MTKPLQALDLFCGVGGASLGLHRNGYETLGMDSWPLAVESHRANGMTAIIADLNVYSWESHVATHGRPDLVWASPPCQPFSASGKHHGEWDARDGFPAFLRAIAALAPPVVIVENVRGLTFKKHRPYLDRVLGEIEALGYEVNWRLLNTANYGVPQTRERVFIVGRNDGVAPVIPEPTHAKGGGDLPLWVTMADALGWTDGLVGFPRRDDGQEAIVLNGVAYRARDLRTTDEPSWTITEKARSWQRWLNPGQDAIRVTPHEALVLQGFPANYVVRGPRTKQFLQIGNAVPPQMATVIAAANRPIAEVGAAA